MGKYNHLISKNRTTELARTFSSTVSPEAVDKLIEYFEEFTVDMCKEASKIAQYAGRKTLKKEDVMLAWRRIYENNRQK